MSAAVEQLSFVDLDLDASELGGEVTWSPPTVTRYKQSGFRQAHAPNVAGYILHHIRLLRHLRLLVL